MSPRASLEDVDFSLRTLGGKETASVSIRQNMHGANCRSLNGVVDTAAAEASCVRCVVMMLALFRVSLTRCVACAFEIARKAETIKDVLQLLGLDTAGVFLPPLGLCVLQEPASEAASAKRISIIKQT